MRIARFVLDQAASSNGTGFHAYAHGGLHLAEPHEVEPADVTRGVRAGAVIGDLLFFSHIASEAEAAGSDDHVLVDTPAQLPAELDPILVDWSAGSRVGRCPPVATGQTVLFGPHPISPRTRTRARRGSDRCGRDRSSWRASQSCSSGRRSLDAQLPLPRTTTPIGATQARLQTCERPQSGGRSRCAKTSVVVPPRAESTQERATRTMPSVAIPAMTARALSSAAWRERARTRRLSSGSVTRRAISGRATQPTLNGAGSSAI